jgi:hypothetical protein
MVVVFAYYYSSMEHTDRSLTPPQTKMGDPIRKITKEKRAGGVAQVVECLSTARL